MKKITDEYANEVLEPILTKYIQDENIIELYNKVAEVDEELIPLALFFAQRVDITKYLDKKVDELPDLAQQMGEVTNYLNENKETLDELAQVINFNDPRISNIMDIITKQE